MNEVLRLIDVFQKKGITKLYHGTHSGFLGSFTKGKNGIDLDKAREEAHKTWRRRADFGLGFYTTSCKEKAVDRAVFCAIDHNNHLLKRVRAKGIEKVEQEVKFVVGLVIEYEIDFSYLDDLEIIVFTEEDVSSWGEFIFNNRTYWKDSLPEFHNLDRRYDLVYGPIGDNDLGGQIRKLRDPHNHEFKSLSEFAQSILPKDPRWDQLSIHTDQAKNCLIRKGVELYAERKQGHVVLL